MIPFLKPKTNGNFKFIFSNIKYTFNKPKFQNSIINNRHNSLNALLNYYSTNTNKLKTDPSSQEVKDLINIGNSFWNKYINSKCPVEKHELSLRIAGAYSRALDIEDSFESASDLYMKIGICYIEAKKYFVACKALETSLEMDPDNFKKNMLLADALFHSKSWNRAIEMYTKLLTEFSSYFKHDKSNPDENKLAEVLYKRALCYDNLNDSATAQEAYISVLKTTKSKYTPLSYYRLAWMEGVKGNWKSCNNVLNIGLKIDPFNPLLLDLKSTAVYVLGKKDESRQYFYALSKILFKTIWDTEDSKEMKQKENINSTLNEKKPYLRKLIML